jgi:hypothetical protein
MHPKAILREIQQLYGVSDRLDSLAKLHPLVSEALITISANVRNTATLLDVLVATKNSAALRIRFTQCLICSSLFRGLVCGLGHGN